MEEVMEKTETKPSVIGKYCVSLSLIWIKTTKSKCSVRKDSLAHGSTGSHLFSA